MYTPWVLGDEHGLHGIKLIPLQVEPSVGLPLFASLQKVIYHSSIAAITSSWQPSAYVYFMSFWTSWWGMCASLGNSLKIKTFPNAKIVLWLPNIKQRSNLPALKPNLPWPQGHTSKPDRAKVTALLQRVLQLPYNQISFPGISHKVWDRQRIY